MGELLPSIAAQAIKDGLLDYLDTTFALADPDARTALGAFLSDRDHGLFRGPYLRLRLPFQPADPDWHDHLSWHPRDDDPRRFAPYHHQAAAFARLSSLTQPAPQPTLITTGTGSGKTESFLYPILDHVVRAKAVGVGGVKALLIYPMNALANDQAQRIAELITSLPTLSGVTAALYTGEDTIGPKAVTAQALIGDRGKIRSDPPDLLLTNYKMLDQLLLRADDAAIWQRSARSLRYLVLDEFHTYDGAQGTDLVMLLRRLGLTLKAHGAEGEGPLAGMAPVATSATLGDGADPDAMREFAETVFGLSIPAEAIVTERRLTVEEWVGDAEPPAPLRPREGRELAEEIGTAVSTLGADPDPGALADAVIEASFDPGEGRPANDWLTDEDDRVALIRAHPLTSRLLVACTEAVELRELAATVLAGAETAVSEVAITAYAGVLSHLRATVGRALPSVDLHLWIRELTRVDRFASLTAAFAWSDDGDVPLGADPDQGHERPSHHAFPAIYCRHCGRSGWGITLSPANEIDLAPDDRDIRRGHSSRETKFRPLLMAPREGQERDDLDEPIEGLRWLHVSERQLLADRPSGEAARDGSVLPVLTHVGPDADADGNDDRCPACQQRDGIRFLGSAIATQLSVTLSTLFGSVALAPDEKKALIFTDSVQDAAHRAGFVQARSRSLTLRSLLCAAIGDQRCSLEELPERLIAAAGDVRDARYRLLPPDLVDEPGFKSFWEQPRLAAVRPKIKSYVRRRLAFDAALEFGLQSRVGRTLELTGTIAAEVEIPEATIDSCARRALRELGDDQLVGRTVDDTTARRWVRGVLERMRERGAIAHPWLARYIQTDGDRYAIWRGRPRREGMPAFPKQRPAPAFPRIGRATRREGLLDSVASSQSWYAGWAASMLGLAPSEGAAAARLLFERLAAADVVSVTSTDSGARVYALEPSTVVVEPIGEEALIGRRHLLLCDRCQNPVPGTAAVIDQLDGARCVVARCGGTMMRSGGDPANFYRRFFSTREVQRVIAREHTALLDAPQRLAYENGFKGRSEHPDAPNVLVATPTLEMGIDIGDLSTVMLASLPRTVASYLQRVGRAGRLTGSALCLAYVSGRGDQLPKLGDPASLINGAVRPPATYLDAEEILRRQFIATLADVEARDPDGLHPFSAVGAIRDVAPGSYLHSLATRAEQEPERLDQFLAAFPTLSDRTREELRRWVTASDGPLSSALAQRLIEASARWRSETELLAYRITALTEAIKQLSARAAQPIATDEDKLALRTARASQRLARGQLANLKGDYWVAVLERAGLLPSYALFDDSVTLDVGISWPNPDTQEFETESVAYHRGAAQALREFAPNATFYARGRRVVVNAVDLGNGGEAIRSHALCPSCGYTVDVTDAAAPSACPRCQTVGIADLSQRLEVVELRRASSSMRRDEALIDDGRDERERREFTIVAAADIDPQHVLSEWYVERTGLGIKHLRDLQIRWFNLGLANGLGRSRQLASREVNASLFRVCSECGQIDTKTATNSRYEHRPWCSLREATREQTRSIALGRTLVTEGIVVRLPPMTSLGTPYALPSLAAAVMRGLREHLGGAPDHLALETIVDPAPADPLGNREALLIHDRVPGGTGYLAELADPEGLWSVLARAYDVVRTCPCQESGRDACPDCLLPFAELRRSHLVSRAEAENQLRTLLEETDQPLDRTAAEVWTITTRPPGGFDLESKLEQKFRAVLRTRLEQIGATLRATPQTVGERWEITLGGRAWTLDPQQLVHGCKPDFLLRTADPAIPDVAIFCDGWRYHASEHSNRLADDAEKRTRLRDHGMVVLAFTWHDLERNADGGEEMPSWLRPDVPDIVQRTTATALTPGQTDLLQRGPVDLLVRWVQRPEPGDLRQIGTTLPLLIREPVRTTIPDGQTVAAAAAAATSGTPPVEAGTGTAWVWRAGALALVARIGSGLADTEVALVLDDTAPSLASGDRAPWEQWLQLANLLGGRALTGELATEITVRSAVEQGDAVATPPAEIEPAKPVGNGADASGPASFGAAWADATLQELELLREIAAAGLPLPDPGPEVNGIPLGPTWHDQRLTFTPDLEPSEVSELKRDGWQVVTEVHAVRTALNPGGR